VTEKRYEYVVKFLEDDPTITYDTRTPRQVGQAFADARLAAFSAKGGAKETSFVMDGGVFLLSSIKSISEAGPVEVALLNEQNSRSSLRAAQAEAIKKGDVPPDGVGRDGEVIPINEAESEEDDEGEEYEDEPAGAGSLGGLAGLAGG
jgi:hypothetical protein